MLNAVIEKGQSIFKVRFKFSKTLQAASDLNIKYSTAKTIWKIYATEGRIEKRRCRCIQNKGSTQQGYSKEENNSGSSSIIGSSSWTLLGPEFWAINLTKHLNNE